MMIGVASCMSAGLVAAGGANAPLTQDVRRATERSQVAAGPAAGYAPFLCCVRSLQGSAMGIHYVNGDLADDCKLATHPGALMYEAGGAKPELVGVGTSSLRWARMWPATKTPHTLMAQLFHYNPSPNRNGVSTFYALHVWA